MNTKYSSAGFGIVELLVIVVTIVLAVGVGWYGYQAVYQDKSENKKTETSQPQTSSDQTNQTENQSEQTTAALSGEFTSVAHHGMGHVKLVHNEDKTYTLQFDDDFMVEDGPALYVGFGNEGTVDKSTSVCRIAIDRRSAGV